MIDLRERRLTDVAVTVAERVTLEDGSPGARGTVRLRLCDEQGGDEGPLVELVLTAPVEGDNAEAALLREAHGTLRRLAGESVEELEILHRLFRRP